MENKKVNIPFSVRVKCEREEWYKWIWMFPVL